MSLSVTSIMMLLWLVNCIRLVRQYYLNRWIWKLIFAVWDKRKDTKVTVICCGLVTPFVKLDGPLLCRWVSYVVYFYNFLLSVTTESEQQNKIVVNSPSVKILNFTYLFLAYFALFHKLNILEVHPFEMYSTVFCD